MKSESVLFAKSLNTEDCMGERVSYIDFKGIIFLRCVLVS